MLEVRTLSDGLRSLCARAKNQLWGDKRHKTTTIPTDEITKLVHDLQTHQIELELQNEELRKAQLDLMQVKDEYAELYDFAPVGYTSLNMKGIIRQSNQTLAEMLNTPKSQLTDCALSKFVIDEDQDTFYLYLNKILRENKKQCCEVRLHTRLGNPLWVSLNCSCREDSQGKSDQIRIILTDISEQKLREKQIRTLSQALEQSPVSVVITNPSGVIEYLNSAFNLATGYSLEEMKGQKFGLLKSGMPSKIRRTEFLDAVNNGHTWNGVIENCRRNGETFWEYSNIFFVKDASGNICNCVAISEDITIRKQQEEKILHQAKYDDLTNLYNRPLTLYRLEQMIVDARRHNERIAVIYLDLDDFKKINDTLGHEAGDKLLIQTADRLRSSIRGGDTIGRLGGDEFIVLIGGLAKETDLSLVAETLLAAFRKEFDMDNHKLMVTLSIGIAVYPDDGCTASELLRNADSAMYHSKDIGRNTYSFFTDAMNKKVVRRLLLEEHLLGALEREEFHLEYQPQVEILSGQIIGFEALLRWHNPTLGSISPMEFIPITEHTGQILNIGQYVLNKALSMLANWQKKYGLHLTMAVNLSPIQFRDPNLVDFIEKIIREKGISEESFEIEITEGVMMSGYSYISDALSDLRQLGVGIAMDDFGTGYSSLSYLRNYPFDTLKIDREFINDITSNLSDRELVNAAIAMAHSLGLTVVAEGVETKEQLEHLASQECNIAQGFLFSKPLLADEVTEMMQSGGGCILPADLGSKSVG